MKPAAFDYERPSSLAEALDRLTAVGEDAKVLAGGQSLIPLMAMRLARPSVLIDVNRVEDLSFEADRGEYLELGALTRQRVAERSAVVRRCAPLLQQALGHIGHPQIRNRGTIGGSLAHADPAAELPTVAVALDATMVIQRAGGERTVPAADFFTGFFTTTIEPEELLTSVRIPALPPDAGCSYQEFSRRHGDFAVVGVAAAVVLGGDTISQARIALSGVGSVPVRASGAEGVLTGQRPSAQLWAAAGTEAAREIEPTSDLHGSEEYRRRLAAHLVATALETAAGAASGGNRE
jgi:aerobic carbon-monoxide dehydrogenase medium subunit